MSKKKKTKKKLIKPVHISKVDSVQLAFTIGIIVSTYTFLATLISILVVEASFLVKPLEIFYGTIGYSISPIGLLLGTAYTFTDTFIIIWLISIIFNKFVIED